jgi:2-iminobutanoate/2-iminopropanoate deaminase
MSVEPIETPSAPPVRGPYSPAVRAGDWIVCAGQVGVDPATGALVEGGVRAETLQVLANLRAVLGDAEAGWGDVAKVGIFLVDLGDFAAVNELYEAEVGGHRPARSTVQVAALPGGASVEIECWAYVGPSVG